jgi:hypothetical protein
MNGPRACRHPRRSRRGAALLLVLIALAVGLLLVATWLDGRQESVPVAQRIAAGAVARQAAATGLDLAAATIDAEDDWRAAYDAGRFNLGFEVGDAACTLRVTDADTEERPTDDTVALNITCTAVVDDVAMSVERTIDVETSESVIDLTFGETAILVEHELRIRDDAALLPWTARPGIVDGPLVVGSFDGRTNAIVIEDAAVTLGTEVLLVDDRSTAGSGAGWRTLPDRLPRIDAPDVPDPDPDSDDAVPSRLPLELVTSPESDVLSERVRIPARAALDFDGDRVIRSLTDLELVDGASLVVTSGTLVLDAARDLVVRGATITVAEGSQLILRAGRELRLHDAVIVPDAVAATDAATEFASTVAPPDAIVATLDGSDASIVVEGRAAVVLSIIAPGGDVAIRDDAVMHGRIVAANVELGGHAIVYARPDNGHVIGLTTPVGPHREDDGRLIAELADLDLGLSSTLVSAADRIGLPVRTLDDVVEPDPEVVARRSEEIRDRIRRMIDERRRRRGGPRWAWGDRDRDE